jgi:hypothetical protein
MPTARNRNRTTYELGGFIRDAGNNIIGSGSILAEYRKTDDYWQKKAIELPLSLRGMLEPTPYTSTYYWQRPLQAWRKTGTIRFDAYPAQALFVHDRAISLIHPGRNTAADNAFYTLRLLEKTNPFRSEFSVPVFIRELVDIGSMFKLAARSFAGFVGGAYLNYKFGWQTFVQDLKTLASITKAIERRIKEFLSLRKHGGLRRRVYLGGHSGTLSDPLFLANSTWGWSPRINLNHSASVEVWGSVRWVPTRDFREDLRRLGLINLAFKKVFDLDAIDASTVWEMIPFSWLIDYFTSIGTYLRANNGSVKVEPKHVCLVRIYSCDSHGTLVARDPSMTKESDTCHGSCTVKQRTVMTSLPTFPSIYWELLTYSQWQVIAALLLKFRG